MAGHPQTTLDLRRTRTIAEIVIDALRLYARLPLLFIFLAGIVVVPYEAVVLAVVHTSKVSLGTGLVLGIVDLALVDPFIAALQVQALLDLGEGQRPALASVIRRGLSVLPVVAAAEIVAGLGEALGFFFFVIPGIVVAVRWAVAAQVAAVERTNWPAAIVRSALLSRGSFWRILGLIAFANLLTYTAAAVIGGGGGSAAAVAAGVALAVLVHSFATLLANLLYFDLRAREATVVA